MGNKKKNGKSKGQAAAKPAGDCPNCGGGPVVEKSGSFSGKVTTFKECAACSYVPTDSIVRE